MLACEWEPEHGRLEDEVPEDGRLEHEEHEEPGREKPERGEVHQAGGQWRCEEVKQMAREKRGQLARVSVWSMEYDGAWQKGHWEAQLLLRYKLLTSDVGQRTEHGIDALSILMGPGGGGLEHISEE